MNDSFPPLIDGVANVVVNYAKHINHGLGRAIVATPQNPEAQDSDFDFPVLRYPSIDMRKMTGYYAGVPFSGEFLNRIQEEKIDILHTHCPVASTFLARSLREQVKAPVILTYHTKFDIDIEKIIKNPLAQEGAIHALVENISACDEIWVVSKGAGENLVSLGYEGDYIVMPNGVDLPKGRMPQDKVTAVTAGYDLPENVPVYLFVGRLMWYKGIRISLDALAKLAAEGRDFRMVIIGSGADEDEIKAYVRELGLEEKVFFTGAVRDREIIRCWYTRANLFLFPSTFDTNGLVVREAAACSLPSVLVEGSCAAEDVTGDGNALLIKENADSMADCLRRCGFDFPRMREIGEHAATELYASWEDVVKIAYDRYGIVMDRYKSGYYDKRKKKPLDYFWNLSGDLMEAASIMEMEREDLWEDILARRAYAREKAEKTRERIEAKKNRIEDDIMEFEGETSKK